MLLCFASPHAVAGSFCLPAITYHGHSGIDVIQSACRAHRSNFRCFKSSGYARIYGRFVRRITSSTEPMLFQFGLPRRIDTNAIVALPLRSSARLPLYRWPQRDGAQTMADSLENWDAPHLPKASKHFLLGE